MNILYTPLSLKKLCINQILLYFPNVSISSILKTLHLEAFYLEEDFKSRREILEWCLSQK